MARRYMPLPEHGTPKRSNRQIPVGAFISLPPPNVQPLPDPTQKGSHNSLEARVDFAVNLDVRHGAKDGKRGSSSC